MLPRLQQLCNDRCRVAKEDYDFYQVLLSSVASACQPASVLTLFPDSDVLPSVRITPAIETVKAVFKHLEDPEGCREFFATTFEALQASALIPLLSFCR